MKFSVIGSIVASAILATASPVALLDDSPLVGPDPNQVYITGVGYGGTGCPAGTVSQIFSDDRTTVTLIFDKYVASIGPNIEVTENRKNCQLNIGLRYPAGWQYSIFKADYRGYAGMAAGITGTQKSTYYFSGASQQCSTQSVIQGPRYQDYIYTDNVPFTTTVWSPCGVAGNLNINSQVRLETTNKAAAGQLTTDSIDGKFSHIIGVQWRKC